MRIRHGFEFPEREVLYCIYRGLRMVSSCEEYRDQQRLLMLKKRLSEGTLSSEEREEIEKTVRELEKKLKM